MCNFCNGSVNFLIDRDPGARFRFGALQSPEGLACLREHNLPVGYFDSIVLIKDGETYTSSDAVLQIFREMPGLWPWLYGLRIFPLGFRNAVYNWIANHRYGWFGKSDACRIPTPDIKSRFL